MSEYLDKPQADLLDLAVPIIKSNPTWEDMTDVFQQVIDTNVDAPISQLERIRFITNESDDNVLASTARLLGFDLTQDLLGLNSDNLIKLVSQLPMYADYNGTDLFVKFIDLMFNARTVVKNLYTRDYVNFREEPEGKLITEGGDWFKTTHIDLSIELLRSENIVLTDGVKLIDRVRELFSNLAPVALVIYKTSLSETLDDITIGFDTYMPYMEATVVIE